MPQSLTETRRLDVALTPTEVARKADQLATILVTLDELDMERKRTASDFKARIAEGKLERNDLADCVRRRKEARPVECTWVPDGDDKMMDLIRSDTGEVVTRRPRTHKERQAHLPSVE